jgi:spore maturation protein CgeB
MTLRNQVRKQIDRARERLRNSDLYPYWRRIPARRQEAEVELLLARINAMPRGLDVAADNTRQLASRRGERHVLPATAGELSVVGFGARGWEKHGLWASLGRVFRARFFSDDVPIDHPLACRTQAERKARGERLVGFVEAAGRDGPVHMVFLYCDHSNVDAEALRRLRELGAWVVWMGLDDRHTFLPFERDEFTLGVETIAPHADLYWTTWRAGILLHHSIGSRAWLGGLGADPDFYKPVEVPRDLDVLFLGQSYGVRREIVWRLRRMGIAVEARGFGWPNGFVSFEETIRSFSRARIVLGISAVGAMDGVTIMKGRDFEVPMCGACYVTQHVAELSDFFAIGKELACYGDALGAAEQIAWLLRDEAAAASMRSAALAGALARNTWDARLRELFEVLTGQRSFARAG